MNTAVMPAFVELFEECLFLGRPSWVLRPPLRDEAGNGSRARYGAHGLDEHLEVVAVLAKRHWICRTSSPGSVFRNSQN
ncbi:MAG: hypothetical protein QM757_25650 [Paludibaculum sp.]